jgi:hypothetical protein
MHIAEADAAKVASLTGSLPMKVTFEWSRQREIYSNQEWTVLRVRVHDTRGHLGVVKRLERQFPHYVFFNSDILAAALPLRNRPLPLARSGTDHADGLLAGWLWPTTRPWNIRYAAHDDGPPQPRRFYLAKCRKTYQQGGV